MRVARARGASAPERGWRNDIVAALFWFLAVVGVLVMTGAWFLLALASLIGLCVVLVLSGGQLIYTSPEYIP